MRGDPELNRIIKILKYYRNRTHSIEYKILSKRTVTVLKIRTDDNIIYKKMLKILKITNASIREFPY